MPLYTDIGHHYSGISHGSLYLSGPYAGHSSIVASNYTRPAPYFSKSTRSYGARNYTPYLTPIKENHSLVRENSPKYLHSTSKYYAPKPIDINTADIDVSKDRYKRNLDKRESPVKIEHKPEIKEVDYPSSEGKDDSENAFMPKIDKNFRSTIRRERPVVRLHTVRKKDKSKTSETAPTDVISVSNGIGKNESGPTTNDKQNWRDKFNAEELGVEKKFKKSPGERLVEKHLIRDKSEALSDTPTRGPNKSPSFHDICKSISSDTINEDLNPGQNFMKSKRKSKKQSNFENLRQIRRNSAEDLQNHVEMLEELLKKEHLSDRNNVPNKLFKKIMKHKSNEVNFDVNSRSLQRRNTIKKIRSCDNIFPGSGNENVVNLSDLKDLAWGKREVKRIERKPSVKASKKFPKITTSVDIEQPKHQLRLVVDDVFVEDSKKLPSKKFKLNVTVEVEENVKRPETNRKNATNDSSQIPLSEVADNKKHTSLNEKLFQNENEDGEQTKCKYGTLDQIREVPSFEEDDVGESKGGKKYSPVKRGSEGETQEINFWDNIGKRETVYYNNRKKVLEEKRRKEAEYINEEIKPIRDKSDEFINKSGIPDITFTTKVKEIRKSKSPDCTTPKLLQKEDGEDINFWDKIGKRETIYYNDRKKQMEEKFKRDAQILAEKIKEKESDSLSNLTTTAYHSEPPVAAIVPAKPISHSEEKLKDISKRKMKIDIPAYLNTEVEIAKEAEHKSEDESILHIKELDVNDNEVDKQAELKSDVFDNNQENLDFWETEGAEEVQLFQKPNKSDFSDAVFQDMDDDFTSVAYVPSKPPPPVEPFVPLQSNKILPTPTSEKEEPFVPLQSNRFTPPIAKTKFTPRMYDEYLSNVVLMATPRDLRKRPIPQPRVQEESEPEDSSDSEFEDNVSEGSSSDDSATSEEFDNTVFVTGEDADKGTSTSSSDSGFDSSAPGSPAMCSNTG